MNNDAPLFASIACAVFGGAVLATAIFTLGYGPLIGVLTYSLGGAAILVATAAHMATRTGWNS